MKVVGMIVCFFPRVTAELLILQAPMQRQTTFCSRKILHVYPCGCTVDSFSCITGFFRTLISVIILLLQEVDTAHTPCHFGLCNDQLMGYVCHDLKILCHFIGYFALYTIMCHWLCLHDKSVMGQGTVLSTMAVP